ncbi:unnamed protein product [Urochloa humidicola]
MAESHKSWLQTLGLAFQCIGIIYGDIGTSPLYVYSSSFPGGIKNEADVLGVLSLIIYTLIIIPLLKYVFIVLHADDNGDGGTLALYSLISRHANVGFIPDQQTDNTEVPGSQMRVVQWVKQKLESSKAAKIVLFTLTILGTSMVIGDGTLTPSISVLSAVSGIREKSPGLTQAQIVWISVAILFVLFSLQYFGTDKVGYTFAPVISVWFLLIAGIGLYNLVVHDIGVLRALDPSHIVQYFRRNGKDGWVSLGGVILCVTGTEGMFADLGHFNIRAVQMSFTSILFPSVVLSYIGQAAYLRKFPENVGDTFYKSIPAPLFWPTFIVAILAAITASQAMISGAFAILSKALSLGCMPNVRVIHTSSKYEGQVYIPEVNFMMGLASVIITITFRTTASIGNAYGICVVITFLITTHLMAIVMLLIWKKHIMLTLVFYVGFTFTELVYLSSILSKFIEGGYFPLCFALVLMTLMTTWHYVNVKRYWYELDNAVPETEIPTILEHNHVQRIPGVGLLYTEVIQGIPPVFLRLIKKIPCVHYIFMFMSIKHLPVPHVMPEERFLFQQVGPREQRIFRCVVRYGYNDRLEVPEEFVEFLMDRLKMFLQEQIMFASRVIYEEATSSGPEISEVQMEPRRSTQSVVDIVEETQPGTSSQSTFHVNQELEEEKQIIDREVEHWVVYLMGEANVLAEPNSSILKKVVVNCIYTFLRNNLAEGHKALSIPKGQVLKVGITYEI